MRGHHPFGTLRAQRLAVLPAAAYGGYKDARAAWTAGVLAVGDGPDGRAIPQDLQEVRQERTAIMGYDGKLLHAEAACLAWVGPRCLGKRGETPLAKMQCPQPSATGGSTC